MRTRFRVCTSPRVIGPAYLLGSSYLHGSSMNIRSIRFTARAVLTGFIAAACLQNSLAQQSELRPKRTELQKVDVGSTGREASLVTVDFPVGAAEVRHTHPGEYIAYVLEGAFMFDIDGQPTKTYRVGDSFVVPGGVIHSGKNVATGPTRLLITFILEKGKPASTPAP
jgi:quercetin dioxygenase-like cupin family protein